MNSATLRLSTLAPSSSSAVSYTHLDVYKRQTYVPARTNLAVAALPLDALVQVEALLTNGEGTIPNEPQAGDLVQYVNNTHNAPYDALSSQTVAFSHYNNVTAQLPLDPVSNQIVAGGAAEQAVDVYKRQGAGPLCAEPRAGLRRLPRAPRGRGVRLPAGRGGGRCRAGRELGGARRGPSVLDAAANPPAERCV